MLGELPVQISKFSLQKRVTHPEDSWVPCPVNPLETLKATMKATNFTRLEGRAEPGLHGLFGFNGLRRVSRHCVAFPDVAERKKAWIFEWSADDGAVDLGRCGDVTKLGFAACRSAKRLSSDIIYHGWLSGTSGIFVDFFMDCSISRIVSRLGTSESHWIWRLLFLQSTKRRAHLQIFWCVFVFTWCVHWVGTESDWMVIYGMSYHGEPPFHLFQLWTCISDGSRTSPQIPDGETHGLYRASCPANLRKEGRAVRSWGSLSSIFFFFWDVSTSFREVGPTRTFKGMLKSWKNRNSKISKSSLHFLFGFWGPWSFQVARYWD